MTSGGFPAYHMELSQGDTASPGTTGDHPRAELFSLDPSELRRERPAAPGSLGSLSDGDEYWATFAIFIPSNFPSNHDWATLFQRKIDDRSFKDNFLTWFSINVQKTRVDAS